VLVAHAFAGFADFRANAELSERRSGQLLDVFIGLLCFQFFAFLLFLFFSLGEFALELGLAFSFFLLRFQLVLCDE